MEADCLKWRMVYRLITGKQYQKTLTLVCKCFQWIKITLFKFRKMCCLNLVGWFIKNVAYKKSCEIYLKKQ